ncbi:MULTISPECIES: hypothetical protein [Paenibacillus]|uniref:hypothetical protein n=1 Tax=Paenibacillus TaxID=44249 RepID=UPI000F709E25|nr:hypothetical protein [Paenibacillus sp. M-152]AZH29601.1 hypothetical protein EGM68_12950 [Paenibacillus sp. M-152]MEE4569847.1 hypothetical protein [Paenibacillus polymyxa]
MKKILSLVIAIFLCFSVPLTTFASNEGNESVENGNVSEELNQDFILVESNINPDELKDTKDLKSLTENNNSRIETQAKGSVGGYGKINCKNLKAGKMSCNWSITLTKKGEAIQSIAAIFDVKNLDGDIVGKKDFYVKPLGGNYKTYRDQMDFNPGAGSFKVEKYGAVEGRYAVYTIVAVTGSVVKVTN